MIGNVPLDQTHKEFHQPEDHKEDKQDEDVKLHPGDHPKLRVNLIQRGIGVRERALLQLFKERKAAVIKLRGGRKVFHA